MTRRILLTGAAGKVGTFLRRELADHYRLRLTDLVPIGDLAVHEESMVADLRSMDDVMEVMAGVDGVVHLGGIPTEADWPSILANNIEGTYHVFEAARQTDVERVVFASSNHVVGFHPAEGMIGPDAAVRPDSRYGVSKAFGESLGSLYADKYGRRVTCLRIGHVLEVPTLPRHRARWLSPRDLAQLVRIGLDHPEIRYEILYGISDNDRAFWDISRARELGYQPQDRPGDHPVPEPQADADADRFSGGDYVVREGAGAARVPPRRRRRWWHPR